MKPDYEGECGREHGHTDGQRRSVKDMRAIRDAKGAHVDLAYEVRSDVMKHGNGYRVTRSWAEGYKPFLDREAAYLYAVQACNDWVEMVS